MEETQDILLVGKWAATAVVIISTGLLLAGFVWACVESTGWIFLLSIAGTSLLWIVRPAVRYRVSLLRGNGANPWQLCFDVSIFGSRFIHEQLGFQKFQVRHTAAEWPSECGVRVYVVQASGECRWATGFAASVFCGPQNIEEVDRLCAAASGLGVEVSMSKHTAQALERLRSQGHWWAASFLLSFWQWSRMKLAAVRDVVRRRRH